MRKAIGAYRDCLNAPKQTNICPTKSYVLETARSNWFKSLFKVYYKLSNIYIKSEPPSRGRDSSVGIATCYGLDGPGIESRWGQDFSHTSRPALWPTQPPIQWVPGLSRG
jgi:hypothetical protein